MWLSDLAFCKIRLITNFKCSASPDYKCYIAVLQCTLFVGYSAFIQCYLLTLIFQTTRSIKQSINSAAVPEDWTVGKVDGFS